MSQQGRLVDAPSDLETLTGNTGGAVPADGSGTINVVGSAPITVSGNPGTSTLTITDDGTLVTTFTEDAGSATPAANNLNIIGGIGIATSGAGSTVTINAIGAGFTWNEVTGTSDSLVAENGYIANNAALVTLTLPATAALGDAFFIVGKGAGLYRIAQNVGQAINFTASTTTTGVGGSLTAIEQFGCLEIICTTANTTFTVVNSTGNFTVV